MTLYPNSNKEVNPNYVPPASTLNNTCKKCEDWQHERLWIGYKFCPYCGRVLED